jgi:thioredoxin reductase
MVQTIFPLVISRLQSDGELTMTNKVEKFPGFPNGMGVFEFTENMKMQAGCFGTLFVDDKVKDVSFGADIKKLFVNETPMYMEP